MRLLPGAAVALVLPLVFSCGGKTSSQALPTPPAIKSFLAAKTRIAQGESVELTYTAEHATSAELVDQTGARIELAGDASSGSARVSPRESSFYVLRVTGEGGRDNAFVQVAVDEDLKEVALVAVPPRIVSGETTQLIWTAHGAKSAQLQSSSGDLIELAAAEGSGLVEVRPARTTAYSLVGEGFGSGSQSTSAEVKVEPRLSVFEAAPAAARPGEAISFHWKTAGASEVVLTEATFGQLQRVAAPAELPLVDEGTFQWTVPETLPAGAPTPDGLPLKFTLTVSQGNPAVTLERVIESFVGEGPRIVEFSAPAAVTEGKAITLQWSTLNAERVQIFANGGLIHEPLSVPQGSVATSSLTLTAPSANATYTLVAWGHENTRVEARKVVQVVKLPTISSFTVPTGITRAGDPASAEWATANATVVSIRVKNGPAVFTSNSGTGKTNLYPGLSTTFVLEAWNLAGDKATAERTVRVGTPGNVTATPTPVIAGETVTVSWDLSQSGIAEVFGDPTSPVLKNNPGVSFYDLTNVPAASTLIMGEQDDAVAQLAFAVPFRFPFLGRNVETFYASTNGFLSFDPVGALPDNAALTQPGLPAMIAPFWDNLSLGGTGQVLYLVEGQSFPRRLIVQWDKVHTDEFSELTFQVQLLETGEVRIAYGAMSGVDSAGEGATIGWRSDDSLALSYSVDTANVTSFDELSLFSSGAFTGQFDMVPARAGAFTLFGRRSVGGFLVYSARLNVLAPGAIAINEVMVLPEMSATAGQWIELANASSDEVDLSGTTLNTTANALSLPLPEGLTLAPGQFLIIGQSTLDLENGGVQVGLSWPGLLLDSTSGDEVTLSAGGAVLASFSYSSSELTAAQSVQPPEPVIDSSGAQVTCARSATFGMNGAIGTPGAPNEGCFDYALSTIPVDYEDISASGTAVFTAGTRMDTEYKVVDFSSAPVTFFGAPHPTWTVTSNGVVAPGTHSSAYTGNKAKPSTTNPTGSVAVFWDDLAAAQSHPDANVFYQRIPAGRGRPGHWIVQWKHMEYYGSSPDDDMNFQVKFFDDGVIEYHFAAMVSTDTENAAAGTGATTWLENPAGSRAMVIGINSAYMSSDRAWRFTPKAQVQP